jgi:hypothetical protein
MKEPRVAELQYSKAEHRLELVVPHGTKSTELAKIIDFMANNFFGKLPRGCLACTSGDHFNIRERLENVIRVDLDQQKIIGP